MHSPGNVVAVCSYLTATLRRTVGQASSHQYGHIKTCVWDLPDYACSNGVFASQALNTRYKL